MVCNEESSNGEYTMNFLCVFVVVFSRQWEGGGGHPHLTWVLEVAHTVVESSTAL